MDGWCSSPNGTKYFGEVLRCTWYDFGTVVYVHFGCFRRRGAELSKLPMTGMEETAFRSKSYDTSCNIQLSTGSCDVARFGPQSVHVDARRGGGMNSVVMELRVSSKEDSWVSRRFPSTRETLNIQ